MILNVRLLSSSSNKSFMKSNLWELWHMMVFSWHDAEWLNVSPKCLSPGQCRVRLAGSWVRLLWLSLRLSRLSRPYRVSTPSRPKLLWLRSNISNWVWNIVKFSLNTMSHRKKTSIEFLQTNRITENLFYVYWISAKTERMPGYLAVAVTLQILAADIILISWHPASPGSIMWGHTHNSPETQRTGPGCWRWCCVTCWAPPGPRRTGSCHQWPWSSTWDKW